MSILLRRINPRMLISYENVHNVLLTRGKQIYVGYNLQDGDWIQFFLLNPAGNILKGIAIDGCISSLRTVNFRETVHI